MRTKNVNITAMQSAGLAAQKPGGPGFLPPDRFEPTGPAKAGPAKTGPAKKKKKSWPSEKKAGPAKKSRAGTKQTGPAKQSRRLVLRRAALLLQTSQSANISSSAFPLPHSNALNLQGALAREGVSCAPFDVWFLFLSIGHLNSHNSISAVPAQYLGHARDSVREY